MPSDDNREYKSTSKRAKSILQKEEGYYGEFKANSNGLETNDIVAFANSKSGGAILIGVKETVVDNGRQKGEIIGCKISDEEKLKILNMAKSCHPPIDLEIYSENTDAIPFYRVEIPSGKYKPYCTNKGTYVIRGDGRNIPLTPDELLSIFLEEKGNEFIKRFTQATIELNNNLHVIKDEFNSLNKEIGKINNKFKEEIDFVLFNVEKLGDKVESQLDNIFDSAENAESLSDEAMNLSDEAVGGINQLDEKIGVIDEFVFHINDNVNLLIEHFGLEDPRITRIKNNVNELTRGLYKHNFNDIFNENNIIEIVKKSINGIKDEILEQWVKDEICNIQNEITNT